MTAFCTYFDQRYLPRALVMLRSLRRTGAEVHLYALCLDDVTASVLHQMDLPGVTVVPLASLEESDPQLASVRSSRSLVEYYFTCTPALPLHLLRTVPSLTEITYVDADLYFLTDPEPLATATAAVTIVPHRYPPSIAASRSQYGTYNVGWLTFRNDVAGREVLEWWRERCLEWCYDRPEGGKFADQGYLDEWPGRFPQVHVIDHPGVNLAPWNLASHTLSDGRGRLQADGADVVFYHVHGLRAEGPIAYLANTSDYGSRLPQSVRRRVYRPYLRELRQAEAEVKRWSRNSSPPGAARMAVVDSRRARLRRLLRAAAKGDLVLAPAPVRTRLARRSVVSR